jgi:DMSO/TMAO reductase YedYZ molybdopterin-dependent catalytic subunit
MKIRGTSRRHITLAVILISIIVVLLITQACSGPSVTSSRTTVTTIQTSTQIATMTTNTTSSATTNSTPTKITTSATRSTTITTSTSTSTPISTSTSNGQVEATTFEGTKLTPIKDQQLNGIAGTINVNQATYTLTIDGLVNHPLTLSYADLEALPQISVLGTLECVEGWSYTAKWTGPSLAAILAQAGVQSGAVIAIFDTSDDTDGFTSLDLSYINANNIILALKDNDVTLPAANGFPVRVVATGKYGYKWAKWVTRIELSSNTNFLGYWESNGYNNDGDVNGPAGQ